MYVVKQISNLGREEKNEIWLSPLTKTLTTTENSTTNWQHKNATKTSVVHRLLTDWGRSVEETSVSQLFTLFTAPSLSANHKSRVSKRTHIKNMQIILLLETKRKRRRSDPVLWQNPLYQQKMRKPKDNTHKRHQKLRLHNDCGPT